MMRGISGAHKEDLAVPEGDAQARPKSRRFPENWTLLSAKLAASQQE